MAPSSDRSLIDKGKTWVKLPGPYGDTKVGSPSYSDTGAVAHAYAKTAPEPSGWGRDWPHPTAKDKPEDAPLFDLLADWVPDEKARRSLDYAVGPLQERGRDREAEGPGGSQVEDDDPHDSDRHGRAGRPSRDRPGRQPLETFGEHHRDVVDGPSARGEASRAAQGARARSLPGPGAQRARGSHRPDSGESDGGGRGSAARGAADPRHPDRR